MVPHSQKATDLEYGSEVLVEGDERVVRRGWRLGEEGKRCAALFVEAAAQSAARSIVDHLCHEYELRDELEETWAVRPLALLREADRTVLVLEDPGGEPLKRLLGAPLEVERFLRLAIGIAAALGKLHQRGLVHKDIKPANVLVNEATGEAWLTGFGITSRLARERQALRPPETLAGTLAYMAPEQTGRMNRSIDARSDLYAFGITLYEMLSGILPFAASEPMQWVHCHLAKRPLPPAERLRGIPSTLSAIVMKLLAKRAEERYQTATGLERDLRRCLSEWELRRRIDAFQLGARDIPDCVLIPEKLYGRRREVETLLAAFDRIVKGGAPELVLVSGYSGIGKSSIVNELQPVLVPPRGLFASGKFDQYKRDIPYSTLAQAFQSLIRPLFGKTETELALWRDTLRDELGSDARFLVHLVPELEIIIGEPPPLSEVSPQDAQRRFQLVIRRFIGVFARREHPLTLFLDDLQWLDSATLDLVENLLTCSDLRHLLLIGAYRDNEVSAAHPLIRKLEVIKTAGGRVEQITLGPLTGEHLSQLVGDGLCCDPERAAPLAQLVHEKTGGNPFFAIHFIHSLAEEKMLAFDHDAACWSWNLDRIHAKDYTDNVVELMVGRLSRLPAETQTALQHLACLGNAAGVALVSMALETPEEKVHARLWAAVRLQLIERLDASYKFTHDRVQEAAYSQIPEVRRAQVHLRVGRLLAARIPDEKREEAVFEIVNQLNLGSALMTSQDERDQLAELNLIAGKRARTSTAYSSAVKYLTAAAALLGGDCWQRRRDLSFAVDLERSECEFLTGELASAEERLTALSNRAANSLERAAVARLHLGVYTELLQFDRAIAVTLEYLRHVGIVFPLHPTDDEVRREYEQARSRLESIEQIASLPLMIEPDSLGTLDVLNRIMVSAALTDQNLESLFICRAVNLSLERGNCDASCVAYAMFGRIAISRFRDYEAAFRFARIGFELVERFGFKRFQARTYVVFGYFVAPWMTHVRSCIDLARRGLEAAEKAGDLTYIHYANIALNSLHLLAGVPLADTQSQAEAGLATARTAGFSGVIDMITPQLALAQTLGGSTGRFGCFDSELIREPLFERHLAENSSLQLHEFWYWVRKMQARYLSGDYVAAIAASSNARRLLWISTGFFEEAEYHFYSALCHAASWDCAAADDRVQHLEALVLHRGQIGIWAENCPDNFADRAALVGAEIARIEGLDSEAMRLYEEAIRSSRASGFMHNEALAYELAARFYAARGFAEIAHLYLGNARRGYRQWGAAGKVRQLDQIHPQLRLAEHALGATGMIEAPVEQLDLATVVKVSQALSGEIVLEKLLDRLMRAALEHAGAERCLLISPRAEEEQLRIQAEATARGDEVAVQACTDGTTPEATLPQSLIRYVARTRETVLLDDASRQGLFSADPYIVPNHTGSILCLPLINQAKLIGILYLENSLAPRIFTPERITVLKVIASQAAISLENSRLYHDIEDREAKIRRLVDANIIGIFVGDDDGRILEANDAFLRIIGYHREELRESSLNWVKLTPSEWHEPSVRGVAELDSTGVVRPFEKEYFRKDGSRAPVLVGGARLQESGSEAITFVVDLTERKRAEAALRQLEGDFAHLNRVSTMGELAASLVHEITQPIASARNNARAAQNFLGMRPPELAEVNEALGCIVGDVSRAGNIIDRIRAHIKKLPPRKEFFDLNPAIEEVIALARNAIIDSGVTVRMHLAEGISPIEADRVQVQQVVLNLILNAVEAMASVEGARDLSISTEPNHTGLLVTVCDSGPGIDPEHREHVFQSFYTTKSGGTGMGLSICRSIIEAHGGRLWADANEPCGAVFRFVLPN